MAAKIVTCCFAHGSVSPLDENKGNTDKKQDVRLKKITTYAIQAVDIFAVKKNIPRKRENNNSNTD
jgi:hypothetical protein